MHRVALVQAGVDVCARVDAPPVSTIASIVVVIVVSIVASAGRLHAVPLALVRGRLVSAVNLPRRQRRAFERLVHLQQV